MRTIGLIIETIALVMAIAGSAALYAYAHERLRAEPVQVELPMDWRGETALRPLARAFDQDRQPRDRARD